MIITYFIGEDGKSCLESIEVFEEYLNYLKEIKEVRQNYKEYYGLTPEQIAICKEAKAINKIKYEEALKIKWIELSKNAIRPNDKYHNSLLKNVVSNSQTSPVIGIKSKKKKIEIQNPENENEIIESENTKLEIKSPNNTPRRRRILI